MAVSYSVSDNLRNLAQPLVRQHHKALIDLRVQLEFVFSDVEHKTNSKHRGFETKVFSNLPGWLAGHPRSTQFFEPFSYVCQSCVTWSSGEPSHFEIGGKMLKVCEKCLPECLRLDKDDASVISASLGRMVTAEKRERNGHEENPGLFCVLIHEKAWRNWSEAKRLARLDHCLTRCHAVKSKRGEVKLSLRAYDIVEYTEVFERHGVHIDPSGTRLEAAVRSHAAPNLFNQGQGGTGEDEDGDDDDGLDDEGIPSEWSSTRAYSAGAIVIGSDTNHYKSVMGGNLGFDPVDSAVYWRRVGGLDLGTQDEDTDAFSSASPLSMADLRAKATELGIEWKVTMSKAALAEAIAVYGPIMKHKQAEAVA